MNKGSLSNLKKHLENPQKVVLVPHRNPDGDAMGSCLAMYHYLKNKGHQCTVIAPNDFPEFLKWMPGADKVLIFENEVKKARQVVQNADTIFLLDFNVLHRTGIEMEKSLKDYKGTFVMIDHHQQPEDVAEYLYSDTTVCATCQMVYQFLEKLNDVAAITPTIATCLYTGIMTDTGSFKFASTSSKTHRVVADLMDKGAVAFKIQTAVFDNNSYNRYQLLSCALANMKVLPQYKTAYTTLSQEELNTYNFQKGDTEGFVNYALSLKGIILAAIFIENKEQEIIKISFRSKGEFSVNTFARKHFSGGGHNNAAGGKSELSMEDTVAKFVRVLPQYKQELHSF